MDQGQPVPRRSRVEIVEGTEQMVVRYPFSRVLAVFFAIWITLWTLGCAAGCYALFTVEFEPSLAIFVAFLVTTWLLVAAIISWNLAGEEVIRVEADRLIHAVRAPGWRRQHVYPVAEISALSSDAGPRTYDRGSADNPPLSFSLSGVVKFAFRGRTVRMAKGQSAAEGEAILAWLATRLPRSATEPSA